MATGSSTRRHFVGAVMAGAALASAGAVGDAEAVSLPAGDVAPWWLVAPLTRGSELVAGWVLGDLAAPHRGAVVVTLVHPERGATEVHLSGIDGTPRGVASSHFLDFIVMDGGEGDRMTDPGLAAATEALACAVRRAEAQASSDPELLARLLPHADRVGRWGATDLSPS